MVQPRNVREMAARLGNPLYFHVKKPDEGTRHRIDKWFEGENSKEIPQDAWHLVLVDTYFGTIPDQPFQYNIVEVTVLGQGGWQLSGYERACFPVHKVQSWMNKHCAVTRRKKHVLSALQSRTADM
jgi:hypothetical protein